MQAYTLTAKDLKESYPIHETKLDEIIHMLAQLFENVIDRALGTDPAQSAMRDARISASGDSGKGGTLKRKPLTNPYNAACNSNKKP